MKVCFPERKTEFISVQINFHAFNALNFIKAFQEWCRENAILEAQVVHISKGAAMVKIPMYARPCIYNQMCAVSLRLQGLAARFQNFQDCFSFPSRLSSILELKIKNEIFWIIFVSKSYEHMAFSSDAIRFGVNDTLFPNAIRFMASNERNWAFWPQLRLCDSLGLFFRTVNIILKSWYFPKLLFNVIYILKFST